jgi:nucleotide-binding universal stress UspA family protein
MFANVIVAVDGHPHDRDAIALARQLGDPAGRLGLVHVHLDVSGYGDSQRLLKRIRQEASISGEVLSITGRSVADGLREVAGIRGADLLVLGSCGHGAFGRAMLGDDTHASLVRVMCAVAVAPTGYAARQTQLASVGFGYECTRERQNASDLAHALAASCNAEVSELSVEELDTDSGELDLLVLGARSCGAFRGLMPGSPSKRLARNAPCPLLLPAFDAAGLEGHAAALGSVSS